MASYLLLLIIFITLRHYCIVVATHMHYYVGHIMLTYTLAVHMPRLPRLAGCYTLACIWPLVGRLPVSHWEHYYHCRHFIAIRHYHIGHCRCACLLFVIVIICWSSLPLFT